MIIFNGIGFRDLELAELFDNATRGMKQEELLNINNLIKIINDNISLEEPNFRYVSANLLLHKIKEEFKETVGNLSLYQYIKMMVDEKQYTNELLIEYNESEINDIEKFVNDNYNYEYDYAGMNLLEKRYLTKNKQNKVMETPELMYIAISMMLAIPEKRCDRINKIKDFYNSTHSRKISLATPILLNLRKINGSLSSCFILSADDSLLSINHTINEIGLISQQGGGVGVNVGRIRATGSMIGQVPEASSGIMSWIKIIDTIGTAVNQKNSRNGAVTVAVPVWHYDIEQFIHCQTENGDLRSKAFNIFPQVIFPDLFMQKAENNEDWHLFCPYEVKKEFGVEINEVDKKEFEELYYKIIDNKNIRKKTINAKYLLKEIMKTQTETGMPYTFFKDTVNETNPNIHDGVIENANLCVVGETKILTKGGYKEIKDLINQEVELWNGEEWSLSKVFQTGENQKIIEVSFSNGQSVECTEYHRFPILRNGTRKNEYDIIVAKDLKVGDKLIKHSLPIIEGELELIDAYTNGFYSGDGSMQQNGYPQISLYGEKIKLIDKLNIRSIGNYEEKSDRKRVLLYKDKVKDKFFVPDASYTIKSRLEWLAGILDSDGCLLTTEGYNTQTIQLCSINKEFLQNIHLMLQTMGISSKICDCNPERETLMPDGKGGKKLYQCKRIYRIILPTSSVYNLAELGLQTFRLKIDASKPSRSADRFVKVVGVIDNNKKADTFCFTEPKRNTGMFNGTLLLNCAESYSNFKPSKINSKPQLTNGLNISQDITSGVAHTCNLVSPNLALIDNDKDLEQIISLSVNILDNTIELTETPIPESKLHNEYYRIIGVGGLGLADWLAKRKLTYRNSTKQVNELFEKIAYYGVKESVRLAKERGVYPLFEGSEWSKGVVFGKSKEWFKNNETNIDKEKWYSLLDELQRFGIRNGGIFAMPPNTSSSLLVGATASILPPYSKMFVDKNSKGAIVTIPPFLNKDTMWYYQENKNIPQEYVINTISTIQQWVDQGISGELLLNIEDGIITEASQFYDLIMLAWKKKMKTIYYIRQVKETIDSKNSCLSCSN